MNITVRGVVPDDAEGVIAIFNPVIESGKYTIFDAPFTVEAERDYILNMHPRGLFHVAVDTDSERIVGFQSMDPFATYTRAFDHVGMLGTYVDPEVRRQGVAKKLFQVTFKAAREKGYEKLFTYVRGDNPGALATYLSQGFSIVGTAKRQAKINGVYVDEIVIEKFL
jgi:L-amino acid N-acyltransferase YncA